MSKVNVVCTMGTYDEDERWKGLNTPKIEVRSHWNYENRVHLTVGDEHHIVLGSDLIDAVQRAMSPNHYR